MIEFLRLLNRPCRDMTGLISAAQDRDLPRTERFAVWLHLLYCVACRRFSRQVRYIRQILRGITDDDVIDASTPALSPEARERMKRSLSQR
ncbi:MAG: zf-HC2 domain-containing protein [Phycisphaerales bacterium]|nr:MAG: zf-HC2 domain-containing protein [Phycisphaerales bacterium]